MTKDYKKILARQEKLREDTFMCVAKLWNIDMEESYVEVNVFWVDYWDVMFSMKDMLWILEYSIPKEIYYERYDTTTESYLSDRVKQAIKDNEEKHKDYPFNKRNLISFYKYFRKECE